MPEKAYRRSNFQPATIEVIRQANRIARDYGAQGFSLTLRQLYYRFVSQDLIPNTQQSYKRLGSIINDARYAGMFDWEWITDRTRNATGGDWSDDPSHPETIINPRYYAVSQWEGQRDRVEVWVEKDALIDVIQKAANPLGAVTFSCRGYTSSSEIWAAAQRVEGYLDNRDVDRVTILHLGDHDPSGIDMTRDIGSRMLEFVAGDWYPDHKVQIKRIALNMDQVEQYDPPPNPAKETDSRFADYSARFGDESWELDALEPNVLVRLIQSEIRGLIDVPKWDERRLLTANGRNTLQVVRDHYDEVIEFLRTEGLMPDVELEDDEATEADDD